MRKKLRQEQPGGGSVSGDGREPEREQPDERDKKTFQIEKVGDIYEVSLDIETVADYLSALKYYRAELGNDESDLEYDEAMRLRKEVGQQIVTIEWGMRLANLSPGDFKVTETEPGVLGLYNTVTRDKFLSVNNLLADRNLTAREIAHVADHENRHSRGLADEAVAEYGSEKKFPLQVKFYPEERQLAEGMFKRQGMEALADIYDISKPEEVTRFYLETELEYKYRLGTPERKKLDAVIGNRAKFDDLAAKEKDDLSANLKKALPRLHDKLEDTFSYRVEIKKILEGTVKEK